MNNKGKKCAREECDNLVERINAKYCCADCKVIDEAKRKLCKKALDKSFVDKV